MKLQVINVNKQAIVVALDKILSLLIQKETYHFEIWVIINMNDNYIEDINHLAEKLYFDGNYKILVVSFHPVSKLRTRFPFVSYYRVRVVGFNIYEILSTINSFKSFRPDVGVSPKTEHLWWDFYLPHSFCGRIHHLKALPRRKEMPMDELNRVVNNRLAELQHLDRVRKFFGLKFTEKCEFKWYELLDQCRQTILSFENYNRIRANLYRGIVEVEGMLRQVWNIKKGSEPWLIDSY